VTAEATPGLIQLKVINLVLRFPTVNYRIFNKFYRIPSTDPWKQGGLDWDASAKLIENLGVT